MKNQDEVVEAAPIKSNASIVDSADDILSLVDDSYENLFIPEWNKTVRIRALRGEERDAFEQSLTNAEGKQDFANARAKLTMLSVVNSQGERIFTKEQIAALGKKSAKALDRIYQAAAKLSGLTQKDVDELVKNSDADHSAALSLQ